MQEAIDWIVSNQIAQNLTNAVPTGRDLSQMNQFSTWLEDANRYGCWCYFGDVYNQGKSHPVSELDGYCKQLHDGYECATMDHSGCEPWSVDYNLNNGFFLQSDEMQVQACNAANS